MSKAKKSKLLLTTLLLAAGAVQAAGPVSVSEVPAAWYADRIVVTDTRGATNFSFPTAAYEHGPTIAHSVLPTRTRPSVAFTTPAFPASPNESGRVL
jgi:hypothetical protein